jgi:hypothetical protein
VASNKVFNQGFNSRLRRVDYTKEKIGKFREQCKNVYLRHNYLDLNQKIPSQWKK